MPPFPEMIPQWRAEANPGVVLPMYEGSRVCGYGTILWVEDIRTPLTDADKVRFDTWLHSQEPGF